MSIIHRLVEKLRNAYAWSLDYTYVFYWQMRSLLSRAPSRTLPDHSSLRIDKMPIILIPGIYESWFFMQPLMKALASEGHPIHVVEKLGHNIGDVDKMAELVRLYIKKNKLRQCVIVAHSKGGLIGKYLMIHLNDAHPVRGMIALNTPFAGSLYAYFFPLRAIRNFASNSSMIISLDADNKVNNAIVSIYGLFDPHIPGGSYLKGAHNIQLPTRGHFRILRDKRVQQAVLDAIKQF